MLGPLTRGRKGILVTLIALVVVYVALDVPRDGAVGQALWPWTVVFALAAAVLSVWTSLRPRPAALVTTPHERSFEAPPSPAPILAFAALTPIVAEQVSTTIDRVGNRVDPWWLDIVISAIWVVALVLVGRLVRHGAGVRLSPDGIRDRRLFGQLFVPWDAVDPDHAPAVVRSFEVMPAYRRPELVRGRRRPISAWNVDSRFLARVIREYAGRPESRPAIGTAAELDRLVRENEPLRG